MKLALRVTVSESLPESRHVFFSLFIFLFFILYDYLYLVLLFLSLCLFAGVATIVLVAPAATTPANCCHC